MRANGTKARECHREDLVVNVRDIGWDDWIIAPPSFNIYKCVGVCAVHSLPNAINHAFVQAVVQSVRPSEPGPCCTPTKLAPLPVLYIDNYNRVILKNYEDMVVMECGCH